MAIVWVFWSFLGDGEGKGWVGDVREGKAELNFLVPSLVYQCVVSTWETVRYSRKNTGFQGTWVQILSDIYKYMQPLSLSFFICKVREQTIKFTLCVDLWSWVELWCRDPGKSGMDLNSKFPVPSFWPCPGLHCTSEGWLICPSINYWILVIFKVFLFYGKYPGQSCLPSFPLTSDSGRQWQTT